MKLALRGRSARNGLLDEADLAHELVRVVQWLQAQKSRYGHSIEGVV